MVTITRMLVCHMRVTEMKEVSVKGSEEEKSYLTKLQQCSLGRSKFVSGVKIVNQFNLIVRFIEGGHLSRGRGSGGIR